MTSSFVGVGGSNFIRVVEVVDVFVGDIIDTACWGSNMNVVFEFVRIADRSYILLRTMVVDLVGGDS